MAVTYNRYEFVTASLLDRLRNARFTPETAVNLDPEVFENPR
jgi:hypothetical protein